MVVVGLPVLLVPIPQPSQYSKMVSNKFMFTIFYILVSLCFIAPPREFVSAGLTVQNLLSSYLGSEDMDFTGYHLKRTTATVVFHSLLPLGKLICDVDIINMYYDNWCDCIAFRIIRICYKDLKNYMYLPFVSYL